MALKQKIADTTRLGYYEGKIPMQYRYTAGLGGDKFLKGILAGKLFGSVAEASGTVYCPPRIFCEDSFEAIENFVELELKGILESFTISCEDLHGDPLAEPVILGFARVDGTDGGLVAPLACDIEELEIGMPIKIGFKPKKEREGAITDLLFSAAD